MGGGRAGFGRALATGATLRAGFHYGPQAGRMALDKAQTVAAARFGKGVLGGGKGDAAATQPRNGPSKDPSKGGPNPPARRSETAAPRHPNPTRPTPGKNGTANEMGSPAAAAHNAKTRAAMGKGAMAANGSGRLRLAGGEFNGPETLAMSDAKKKRSTRARLKWGRAPSRARRFRTRR